MENDNRYSSQSNDQLCHIFNYGSCTFCLVCKRVISGNTSCRRRQNRISSHLHSSDHVESMRTLFNMCVADPSCDSVDEKCLDIVTKSIFDISVILGKESSYICQRDGHLVCLMCNSCICTITSSFAEVKVKITQHLENSIHTKSIKEVCWFYRLNSKDAYLLLHKSIIYCSICKETFVCKEAKLLQTAVSHIESDRHGICQTGIDESTNLVKESSNILSKEIDNLPFLDRKHSLKLSHSTVKPEILNCSEYEEEEVEIVHESQDHLEKKTCMMATSQMSFSKYRKEKTSKAISKSDVNAIHENEGSTSKEQSVDGIFFYNHCDSKNENNEPSISEWSYLDPVIQRNVQFILMKGKNYCCSLCHKRVTEKRFHNVMNKFFSHFVGRKHREKVAERGPLTNSEYGNIDELISELSVQSHINKRVESASATSISPEYRESQVPTSMSRRTSDENLNLHQQLHNMDLAMDQVRDENKCRHQCSAQKKALGVCCKYFRSLLQDMHPVIKMNIHFITVERKTCSCSLCGLKIGGVEKVKSIMITYLSHFEGKKHKKLSDKLYKQVMSKTNSVKGSFEFEIVLAQMLLAKCEKRKMRIRNKQLAKAACKLSAKRKERKKKKLARKERKKKKLAKAAYKLSANCEERKNNKLKQLVNCQLIVKKEIEV